MGDIDLRQFSMQPAEWGGGEIVHKGCDKEVLYFEGGISFSNLIAAARLHNIRYHGSGK